MARPDFRGQAAQRLAEERDELSPAIISLLGNDSGKQSNGIRDVPVDRIDANPNQPRLTFDEDTLLELAASITEHGVLQPILVRPGAAGRYQLIAGERRWRAAKIAGLRQIRAIIEEIDDETALEIAIIENLQREDLSPLDEALMYERMTTEHGYSLRKLAQKLGKDKGYIENRLRLADAPTEIKQLVSLRKDTLSHAYELLKVEDPRKRRKLAEQVARGELSLVKLRERIDGKPAKEHVEGIGAADDVADDQPEDPGRPPWRPDPARTTCSRPRSGSPRRSTSCRWRFGDRTPSVARAHPTAQNFAKYLTIAKLKLENAIAVVRAGEPRQS